MGLLSGLTLRQVTGRFEGLMIGTATGCAGWAVFAGWSRLPVLTLGLFSGALALRQPCRPLHARAATSAASK